MAVAPFDARQAKAHQQAWADYLGLPVEKEVELPGNRKLAMILIPPGEFWMGSPREEQAKFNEQRKTWRLADTLYNHIPNEGPQHLVRITQPFYLGKYEVMQDQWLGIMGRNPSRFKSNPNHPVEQVSWDDVQPFLAKLNEAASAAKMQFALPTEAQWEYACRAGTTTYWHCGDSEDALQEYDWFEEDARKTSDEIIPSCPVGQLKPNPFGLYDLHGNVSEWCADRVSGKHNYYTSSPIDDPIGSSEGDQRALRGGSVRHPAWRCRSAWRGWYVITPESLHASRMDHVGFRLVGVLPEK
jgi:formylglycine-generating enzyme required for sulfatase activity